MPLHSHNETACHQDRTRLSNRNLTETQPRGIGVARAIHLRYNCVNGLLTHYTSEARPTRTISKPRSRRYRPRKRGEHRWFSAASAFPAPTKRVKPFADQNAGPRVERRESGVSELHRSPRFFGGSAVGRNRS